MEAAAPARDDAPMQTFHANGIDFACLTANTEGPGPAVLLLHGFPDNAHTWGHQMAALARVGYRVYAPFLRGYPPTTVPTDGWFDKATLVADIAALIEVIGQGEPMHFVGQDWGAIIGYALLAAHPERVRRAVLMAVPHPAEVRRSLLDPRHIHRSFHWWFFQLPELPEQAIAERNYAFIDYLWQYWTTAGFEDVRHIAQVKTMLAKPGVLGATLGYYRAMLDPSRGDPKLAALRERMARPIPVPTLALCGADDLRAELMDDQGAFFTGPYRFERIPGAGHFPQREQPEAVNEWLLDWLGGDTAG